MSFSRAFAPMLLACAVLASCEYNPTIATAGSSSATIRVLNATSQPIDVVTSGIVVPANASLGFGAKSTCINFDPASPDFSIRVTGATTPLPYAPTGTVVGGTYTALVVDDFGVTQVSTLDWGFTPTSGRSGLRVFDALAVLGNFDVLVVPPDSTTSSVVFHNMAFDVFTPFFETPAGSTTVRLVTAGTTSIAYGSGSQSLAAGQSYLLVAVAPNALLTTAC